MKSLKINLFALKLFDMKKWMFFLTVFLMAAVCYSQDMLFYKDGSVKIVKVKIIEDNSIKYKVYEEMNSPMYEVQKSDLWSMIDKYGDHEVFSSNPDTVKTIPYDSSISSTIYILYNYKNDESVKFPLYFNGKYICTLKNHSRLKYTMHSGGLLKIQRRGVNSKDGPTISLSVEPGKSYGINILLMYPQAIDPENKFKYDVIVDSTELNQFTRNKFYGFKPFKADNYVFEEDAKDCFFR